MSFSLRHIIKNFVRESENNIGLLFHILIIFTPLIFYPYTSELFEFNKIIFVYLISSAIFLLWIIKIITGQQVKFRKTFLDLPLGLFLISQLLSTIFSIDQHTSIFGYYSRFNGGLLSSLSYVFLYWAFVNNVKTVKPFLQSVLIAALAVSLWGIPSHFGWDPSCLIVSDTIKSSCWSSDFNPMIRSFSTLGQPNWLAAFLAMAIPLYLAFMITTNHLRDKLLYGLGFLINYLAFTFSYSRGGTFGLISAISLFIVMITFLKYRSFKLKLKISRFLNTSSLVRYWPYLTLIVVLLLINLIFGNALIHRPIEIEQSKNASLETEGTESGKIRLIVWRGALEIFRHYPIFGSGTETFAYSYYQFRPLDHNQVSEWEFLYNKAHNEYLNYLATTGILGFAAYMFLIFSIFWFFWTVFKQTSLDFESKLIVAALTSGITSYLVQNFVQFSVVPIALLFSLYPAFGYVLTSTEDKYYKFKIKFPTFLQKVPKYLYISIVILVFLTTVKLILNYWEADQLYKKGLNTQSTDPIKSYSYLTLALDNFNEPVYRSELAFTEAVLVSSYQAEIENNLQATKEATTSAEKEKLNAEIEELKSISASLEKDAQDNAVIALRQEPFNLNLWRNSVQMYLQLASTNPAKLEQAELAARETKRLAPTEPKVAFTLAKILWEEGKKEEAIAELENVVKLKENYYNALKYIGQRYLDSGQKEKAKVVFGRVLRDYPEDIESLEALEEIK